MMLINNMDVKHIFPDSHLKPLNKKLDPGLIHARYAPFPAIYTSPFIYFGCKENHERGFSFPLRNSLLFSYFFVKLALRNNDVVNLEGSF